LTTATDKLAESLQALKVLQDRHIVAIRSADLSRTHRERLIRQGFLQEVMKGWYIPTSPDNLPGDSTPWYTSYWKFIAAYLDARVDGHWCLSPEHSLSIQAGNWTVPKQLLVRAERPRNNVTPLPHNTSLLDIRAELPADRNTVVIDGVRLFSVAAALIACGPSAYRQNPTDLRAALASIADASELLALLLEGGHSTIAGRLAGAMRNIGRDLVADDIVETMKAAGYDIRETDPFESASPLVFARREKSPGVSRLHLLWQTMRDVVLKDFPAPPGRPKNITPYLKHIADNYVADAYHSLSIEGYRVSPELIERVKGGRWNADQDEGDRAHRNALAARGYWQAFQAVEKSIEKILTGQNAGVVARKDHGAWYRELFAPSIATGLLSPGELAGYRNAPIYIRSSRHVPPRADAVRDLMPALFDLLEEEPETQVRVVLGHFVFVYIHPYMDGNGRMGRFLMNAMMASGGYPWTIVPVERRGEYMSALEAASVEQNIQPFTRFLASLLEKQEGV
jgi:hypothetical protein